MSIKPPRSGTNVGAAIHTAQRYLERYGAPLPVCDYVALCQAASHSLPLRQQSNGRDVRLVGFRGRAVVAVIAGSVVITVLTADDPSVSAAGARIRPGRRAVQ